jgi:hypothetical protein
MTYFRGGAAIAVLLLVVSCANDPTSDPYALPSFAAATSEYRLNTAPPMDPSRTIAREDCTKPVTVDRGNLLCK